MACIDSPAPTVPTLPVGLTLGAAISSPAFDATLCCKILDFSAVTIPALTLGPALGAAMAVLAPLLSSLNDYFDLIPFTCPREAGP